MRDNEKKPYKMYKTIQNSLVRVLTAQWISRFMTVATYKTARMKKTVSVLISILSVCPVLCSVFKRNGLVWRSRSKNKGIRTPYMMVVLKVGVQLFQSILEMLVFGLQCSLSQPRLGEAWEIMEGFMGELEMVFLVSLW